MNERRNPLRHIKHHLINLKSTISPFNIWYLFTQSTELIDPHQVVCILFFRNNELLRLKRIVLVTVSFTTCRSEASYNLNKVKKKTLFTAAAYLQISEQCCKKVHSNSSPFAHQFAIRIVKRWSTAEKSFGAQFLMIIELILGQASLIRNTMWL